MPAPEGGIVELENEAEIRSAPCLSDDDLQALRAIGRKVEKHYGKAQDIEWALDQDGKVLLLQSRPETVWAQKDAKAVPVVAKQADPMTHVMGLFTAGAKK